MDPFEMVNLDARGAIRVLGLVTILFTWIRVIDIRIVTRTRSMAVGMTAAVKRDHPLSVGSHPYIPTRHAVA